MTKDFAVFILTHGRPDRVFTYKTLIRCGYTGPIYIIIDNEDQRGDEYKALFGKQVIIFDKKEISETFDTADISNDRRSIVYARNACFSIARELGYTYFMELDDDYEVFQFRFGKDKEYRYGQVRDFDKIITLLLSFYKKIPAKSLAFAQGGDYIGGINGSWAKSIELHRKCMNSFLCSTKRPFQFVGRVNEDVNTYVWRGSIGELFLTVPNVSLGQAQTQSNPGGMADMYKDDGTYTKSFYTVMFAPSCTTIKLMETKNKRLHHNIRWQQAVPFIVSPDEKKEKA